MVNPMQRSSVKRICGAALAAIAAAALSSCTVGSPGPCNGCIDSNSVAPGAIGSGALQAGAVDGTAIADGAVGTAQLASGAVTGANIAASTITGANIDPTTTINAAAYTLSSLALRIAIVDPTSCQRVGSTAGTSIAPYQDIGVLHPAPGSGGAIGPAGTPGGPSLVITNASAGAYEFYCPVSLNVPVGGTTEIVSASMAYTDTSALCAVSATLNVRDWGSTSLGTIVATAFSGSNASDIAPTPGSALKTNFTSVALPATVTAVSHVFVTGLIQVGSGAVTAPDCRFGGVAIGYTVDRL
jgi:hypothetical protein